MRPAAAAANWVCFTNIIWAEISISARLMMHFLFVVPDDLSIDSPPQKRVQSYYGAADVLSRNTVAWFHRLRSSAVRPTNQETSHCTTKKIMPATSRLLPYLLGLAPPSTMRLAAPVTVYS